MILPVEFMADVLIVNMKRLPLRLEDEKADFDLNATKYHVEHLPDNRRSRAFHVVDGALDGPAVGDDKENDGHFGMLKSSRSKKKKKGKVGT